MNGLRDFESIFQHQSARTFYLNSWTRIILLSSCGMVLSALLCGLMEDRRHEPVLFVSTMCNLDSYNVIAITAITVTFAIGHLQACQH